MEYWISMGCYRYSPVDKFKEKQWWGEVVKVLFLTELK